jgi:hypothetical protein
VPRWTIRLVEDQHGGAGEEAAGQGETLPLATGDGHAVRAGRGIPALRKGADPRQQPGPGCGVGGLLVTGAGPGEAQVLPDAGVEDVRVLRAATDDGPDVVGRESG